MLAFDSDLYFSIRLTNIHAILGNKGDKEINAHLCQNEKKMETC